MTMTIDFPTLQMWGRHLVRGQAIALLQYFSIKGIFDFERTGASLHEIGMTKGNRLSRWD